MEGAPFDVAKANRWFAAELSSDVGALLEADVRSAGETERMIHAAHAACYHWLQVGAALNLQRAECLLSTAYAAAGLPEPALRHAARCLELSAQNAAEQSAFDLATAHGCAAAAHRGAGELQAAARHDGLARAALAKCEHPNDRAVFESLYATPRAECE